MERRNASWLAASALAATLALPATAAAQAPPPPGDSKGTSVSKVERKGKAPVSKDVLRVKLPRAFEAVLDNGVSVLIMEDHRFPGVTLQLQIEGAGGLYDPKDLPGLAGATALMLREGTKTRNSRQLAEEVDKLGATLNAFAGFGSDSAVLSASGLSDNLGEWFPLVADVLLNPTFPAEEMEKAKQRQKVQLRQQRSQPGFLVSERFSQAIYGNHPASVTSTTPAAVDALTSEKLAAWHRERYAPQNAILGIAGDVTPAEIVPKLKQWLGGWPKTAAKPSLPPPPEAAKAKRILVVDRPGSVQTDVALGNLAVDRRSPDYAAVAVMNRVVGGGPAARLFLNLREEKGYTYGVYSSFTAVKYPGPWQAGGNMRTEVTEGAMNEFLKEIGRIRDEPVPAAELDEAKHALVANFALSLEQPAQLLGYAFTRKVYGFPADYWDRYPAELMAVTAQDVQRVARKYLVPETLQVAAVGDGAKIRPVLEKFGPVEAFDIEGRPAGAPK